jgi:hypothetical protein
MTAIQYILARHLLWPSLGYAPSGVETAIVNSDGADQPAPKNSQPPAQAVSRKGQRIYPDIVAI